MIERLLLLVGVVALIALAGMLVRGWLDSRARRIRKRARLPASGEVIPRLLLFTGPNCDACERQKRIIDEVTARWSGPIDVAHVDAARESALARELGVLIVPTTVVARPDGTIAGITSGLVPRERLVRQLAAAS